MHGKLDITVLMANEVMTSWNTISKKLIVGTCPCNFRILDYSLYFELYTTIMTVVIAFMMITNLLKSVYNYYR